MTSQAGLSDEKGKVRASGEPGPEPLSAWGRMLYPHAESGSFARPDQDAHFLSSPICLPKSSFQVGGAEVLIPL